MAKVVDVPGIGPVEFPDEMSDQQIISVIQQQGGQSAASPAPSPRPELAGSEHIPLGAPFEVLRGAAKSVGEMGAGAGQLLGIPGAAQLRERMGNTGSAWEDIGKAGGDIATYMLPLVGEATAAAKAAQFASKIPRLAGLAGRVGAGALNAGTIAALHAGQVGPEAENAALMGAGGALTGGALSAWAKGRNLDRAHTLLARIFKPTAGREATAFEQKVIPWLDQNMPMKPMNDKELVAWVGQNLGQAQQDLGGTLAANAQAPVNVAPAIGDLRHLQETVSRVPGTNVTPLPQHEATLQTGINQLQDLAAGTVQNPGAMEVPLEQINALKRAYGPTYAKGGAIIPEEVRGAKSKIYGALARAEEATVPELGPLNTRVSALKSANEMATRMAQVKAKSEAKNFGKLLAERGLASAALGTGGYFAGGPVGAGAGFIAPYILEKITSSTAFKTADAGTRIAISRAVQAGRLDLVEQLLGAPVEALAAEQGRNQ